MNMLAESIGVIREGPLP